MKIAQLDFLSQKPKLFIDGESRSRNNFGALLSVLSVLIIAVGAGFFLIDFFLRTAPTIVYNQAYNNFSVLNMSKIPIMWMIQDSNYVPISSPSRYWTSYAQLFASEPKIDSSGNKIAVLTKTQLYFEPCNIAKHFGDYKELFRDVPFLSLYQCMNLEKNNITLSGIYGNSKFSYLNVYIIRCTNDTSINLTNCYSMDKINNDLDNVRISIKFVDYTVDHHDINSPGKLIIRSEAPQITTSTFKRFWFYMKVVNYFSDYGYIFPDNQQQTFYQGQDTTETVDLRKAPLIPNSFALFSFLMDKQDETYQRTFIKAQSVLANIGGITKGIIMISQLLNWVLTRKMYFLYFINDLIAYDNFLKRGHEQKDNVAATSKVKLDEFQEISRNIPIVYSKNLFNVKSSERFAKMFNGLENSSIQQKVVLREPLLKLNLFQMILPMCVYSKHSKTFNNLLKYSKLEKKVKFLMDLRFVVRLNSREIERSESKGGEDIKS